MEELEKIFNEIKKENKDYKEHIERGDLYIPHILFNKFKINEIFYICDYYMNDKDIIETDKKMKKMGLSKNQLYLVKKKLKNLNIIKSKRLNISELKKETIKLSHIFPNCHYTFHKLESENNI